MWHKRSRALVPILKLELGLSINLRPEALVKPYIGPIPAIKQKGFQDNISKDHMCDGTAVCGISFPDWFTVYSPSSVCAALRAFARIVSTCSSRLRIFSSASRRSAFRRSFSNSSSACYM